MLDQSTQLRPRKCPLHHVFGAVVRSGRVHVCHMEGMLFEAMHGCNRTLSDLAIGENASPTTALLRAQEKPMNQAK